MKHGNVKFSSWILYIYIYLMAYDKSRKKWYSIRWVWMETSTSGFTCQWRRVGCVRRACVTHWLSSHVCIPKRNSSWRPTTTWVCFRFVPPGRRKENEKQQERQRKRDGTEGEWQNRINKIRRGRRSSSFVVDVDVDLGTRATPRRECLENGE